MVNLKSTSLMLIFKSSFIGLQFKNIKKNFELFKEKKFNNLYISSYNDFIGFKKCIMCRDPTESNKKSI